MKKIFAGLFLTATFAVVSAQKISFDTTTIEYGNVAAGADGQRIFTVKNDGDKPLIISRVQASCGCTTPEWSQDPIMPGKTAPIKVGYNTAIAGPFAKIIEVYSNDPANSRMVLNIKGNVEQGTEARTTPSDKMNPAVMDAKTVSSETKAASGMKKAKK